MHIANGTLCLGTLCQMIDPQRQTFGIIVLGFVLLCADGQNGVFTNKDRQREEIVLPPVPAAALDGFAA